MCCVPPPNARVGKRHATPVSCPLRTNPCPYNAPTETPRFITLRPEPRSAPHASRWRLSLPPPSSLYERSSSTPPRTLPTGVRPPPHHHQTFATLGQPLVEGLVSGQSSVLLTFGVTNSGKSHTVLGRGSGPDAGLVPRFFHAILAAAAAAGRTCTPTLTFACLEVRAAGCHPVPPLSLRCTPCAHGARVWGGGGGWGLVGAGVNTFVRLFRRTWLR